MEEGREKRALLVSKGWLQAVVLVFLFGFMVLGLLAYRTYSSDPPVAQRTVDPQGKVLYTRDDVRKGQDVFLRNGLMEYGSIFGHGAYLGPDYTADYLHRAALAVRRDYGGPRSDRARLRTVADFQADRYDGDTHTLTYTAAQADAFGELERHYLRVFSSPRPVRPSPRRDHRSRQGPPADGVLRMDRVGGVRPPTRPRLLVHQQLAARDAGRQRADRGRARVERPLADRACSGGSASCSPLSGAGTSSVAGPRAATLSFAPPATSR